MCLPKTIFQDIFYALTVVVIADFYEDRGLPTWHPLLSTRQNRIMHKAGMSVRGKTVVDHDVDEQFEDYIALKADGRFTGFLVTSAIHSK
jgi:uncharacterized cysteine cluster protein YcgN (CxxCxxCC family)